MTRILVIEDDDNLRESLKTALELMEYDVETADDGDAGLRVLRDRPVDVVLTDIFMPNQEGLETIRQVRREFPTVAIIAMSGGGGRHHQIDYLSVARHFGASDALRKPFETAELVAAIRGVLREPREPSPWHG